MSATTVDNDLVHYEVLGRGRPVILVHGWLGSWRYWIPTMQQLSSKYRVYALDLWGFGDTGRDAKRFGITDQVRLLSDFMERLGVAKAALVGHSLGAAVAIEFARQYPERAPRVMLVSTPLVDVLPMDSRLASSAPAQPTPASSPRSTSSTEQAAVTKNPASGSASTSGENDDYSRTTIPRNPLKGLGNTPEEILANLTKYNQQQNVQGNLPSTGDLQKAEANRAAQSSVPSVLLPTGIARPTTSNLPDASIGRTVPQTDKLRPPTGTLRGANPLIELLTKQDRQMLLLKSTGRDFPDLEKLREEVTKTSAEAIVQSAQSLAYIDLARHLQSIVVPTLLLHGENDLLFAPPSDDLLRTINRGKGLGSFLPFVEPNLGHFPMLEITAKFNRLLLDFLEAQDLTNVQFKDQWRRTMR